MAFLTLFFASLLTAVVQYLYLAFLDHGRLFMQVEQMLSMPEYEQWLKQMAGGADIEEVKKAALGLLSNPAKMTLQLLWSDTLLSLILSIPIALLSMTGKNKE
jgi:ABC-type sugar transport system permease subunit